MRGVYMTEIKVPEDVARILEKLENAGFEAYAVGGAIRDSLLGLVPHDWDVCTSARPDEMMTVFSDCRIIPTGLKHGTLTVMMQTEKFTENKDSRSTGARDKAETKTENRTDAAPDSEKVFVEVTSFRRESSYSDARRPDRVEFVKSIEEDLARRDFTMNAIAYSPLRGMVDPFGGQKDLSAGVLRCVGDAAERFSEDALRILRALRFLSARDLVPEEQTRAAIQAQYESLSSVSWERITDEFLRLICGKNAASVLDAYRDVFAYLIPELKATFDFDQRSPYHNRDVWHHTLAGLSDIPPVPELRMTMLLHDIAKPVVCVLDDNGRGRFVGHPQKGAEMAEIILKRMKFSNQKIEKITKLIKYHDVKLKPERPDVRRILSVFGEEGFFDLLAVKHADAAGKYEKYLAEAEKKNEALRACAEEVLRDGDCISLKTLAVSGADLRRAGLPEGPDIGRILNRLLDEVIDGTLENEKSALLGAAKESLR